MRFVKRVLIGWLVVTLTSIVAAITVKKAVPAFGDPDDNSFSLVAALGGQEFTSTANKLTDGSALAFMGGVEIDLTGAVLDTQATLQLRAFMGGVEVRVPASWSIEVVEREFMGEVETSIDPATAQDALGEAPLLFVYATAVMGGIEISSEEVG